MLYKSANKPRFQSVSDYVFNMAALNSRDAKRQWRHDIKQAWNNCCAYCGKPPIDDNSLTIDHVRPRSKGGEDSTRNVIPACRSCNLDKGSENWLQWYSRQNFYSIYAEYRIRRWLQTGEVEEYSFDPSDSAVYDCSALDFEAS